MKKIIFILTILLSTNLNGQVTNDEVYFECITNGSSQIINSNNELLTEEAIQKVIGFDSSVFTVKFKDDEFGFITSKNKLSTKIDCQQLWKLSNGFARIKKHNKVRFIDANNKFINLNEYHDAKDFKNGCAAVNIDGKWSFINKDGTQLCGFLYDEVKSFENGFAQVRRNNKWGYINDSGHEVIEPIFTKNADFKKSGYGRVQIGDNYHEWKLIDSLGNLIPSEPNLFISGTQFNDDELLTIKKKIGSQFLYGAMNTNQELVIPIKYSSISTFTGGLYPVAELDENGSSKFGIINLQQEQIIPFEYDDISYSKKSNSSVALRRIDNGESISYSVKIGDQIQTHTLAGGKEYYGVINNKNQSIIPFEYEFISLINITNKSDPYYMSNFYRVETFSKHQGILSKEGKEIIPSKYKLIVYIGDGIFLCNSEDKSEIINISNNHRMENGLSLKVFIGNGRNSFIKSIASNKKIGVVDVELKTIIENRYDEIKTINYR